MATTKIRPHSKYEMLKSVKAQRKVTRVLKAMEAGKRLRRKSLLVLQRYQKTSTRPILREEMKTVLMERMIRARDAKITWQKARGNK